MELMIAVVPARNLREIKTPPVADDDRAQMPAARAAPLDQDQAAAPDRRHHGINACLEMPVKESMPQVGAPDPELKNSPIVDHSEFDDRDVMPDVELESGACYFNGQAYAIGEYVRSGSDVLECAPRGVWVRMGVRRGEP